MKTWKPTAAGALSIIGGAFLLAWGLGHVIRAESVAGTLTRWQFGIVGVILGLIAIAGGIFAIRRRVWGLALAGAICALFPFHPYGSLIWTPVFGILAIVFVALSKNEFSSSTKPS